MIRTVAQNAFSAAMNTRFSRIGILLYHKSIILTIIAGLVLSVLFSAEIKDGQLWLELYLASGNTIQVKQEPSDSRKFEFSLSEVNSPLSGTYTSEVKLQFSTGEEQIMWGIINRTEVIDLSNTDIQTDDNIREKFIWLDGRLSIQHEKLTFEDKYFKTKEAAQQYAEETGYPKKQIRAIPMQNAGLKVINDKGEPQYYQLPVRLTSKSLLKFNKQEDSFQGNFNIKMVDGTLLLTHLQDMENYVAGVVPNEIGNSAPDEALKAQAVAARTHAVSLLLFNRHLDDGYDLCNGTHCQVYKGNYLRSEAIDKCVYDTKGIIMMYESKVADGVYHSSCGGRTEANQNAWSGKSISYLQGVACYPQTDSLDLSYEANAVNWINTKIDFAGMTSWEKRSENWTRSISRSALAKNSGVAGLHTLVVLKRGVSGRIIRLKLIGTSSGVFENEYKIRQLLGGLPSSFFYITNSKSSGTDTYSLAETITIKGKGFGHGVGMCQVGALQKARQGWVWQDILRHYYPQTELSNNWLGR